MVVEVKKNFFIILNNIEILLQKYIRKILIIDKFINKIKIYSNNYKNFEWHNNLLFFNRNCLYILKIVRDRILYNYYNNPLMEYFK